MKPLYVQYITPQCDCVEVCSFIGTKKNGEIVDSVCARLPMSRKKVLKSKEDFSTAGLKHDPRERLNIPRIRAQHD